MLFHVPPLPTASEADRARRWPPNNFADSADLPGRKIFGKSWETKVRRFPWRLPLEWKIIIRIHENPWSNGWFGGYSIVGNGKLKLGPVWYMNFVELGVAQGGIQPVYKTMFFKHLRVHAHMPHCQPDCRLEISSLCVQILISAFSQILTPWT